MAVHDKVWPRTLGNTVRLTFAWWKMALCIRSALTCMMLTFCAWYYPRVLRETGAKTRETGAKRRETGAKKKVYHLTLLFWPSWRVACFWKPFLRMVRTEGMVRREGAAMWSWVCGGACCFSLSLASFSIAPFGSCIGFIPISFGHGDLSRLMFILCVLCICLLWLWCFCVECWALCMRILRVKKMPHCWCGVVKIAL